MRWRRLSELMIYGIKVGNKVKTFHANMLKSRSMSKGEIKVGNKVKNTLNRYVERGSKVKGPERKMISTEWLDQYYPLLQHQLLNAVKAAQTKLLMTIHDVVKDPRG